MQADGPLAQLASDVPPQQVTPAERPDGWFKRIGRSQAHQKSQSLQLGLGLGHGYGSQTDHSGPLASPFDDSNSGHTTVNHSSNATHSLGRKLSDKPDVETMLKSPLELHAPVPTARHSLKRRFKLDEETPATRNSLENLFSNAPASTHGRPTRDRAFSLGSVYNGTRSLSAVFARQAAADVAMTDASASNEDHLHAPEPMRRLGSPFGGGPSGTHFNTFPRHFTPMGSAVPNQSMEERFRELAAEQHNKQ